MENIRLLRAAVERGERPTGDNQPTSGRTKATRRSKRGIVGNVSAMSSGGWNYSNTTSVGQKYIVKKNNNK